MTVTTLSLIDPATEEPLAEVKSGDVGLVDEVVERARKAFESWSAVAPTDRARLLRRFAAQVELNKEELALTETRNVGKPISDSLAEVAMVAEVLWFYAGAVDKHRGSTIPVAGGVNATFHEPLGVVAAIVPWNFPLLIASWKIGPALCCGRGYPDCTARCRHVALRRCAAARRWDSHGLRPHEQDPRSRY